MSKCVLVLEHDVYKLKAVVALLENHATYKNLSLQQLEGLSEVVKFIKELPKRFSEAEEPTSPPLTVDELKQQAQLQGFTLVKEV